MKTKNISDTKISVFWIRYKICHNIKLKRQIIALTGELSDQQSVQKFSR